MSMWLKVLLLVPLDLVLPTNRREQETVPASWRLALAESRMNGAGGRVRLHKWSTTSRVETRRWVSKWRR